MYQVHTKITSSNRNVQKASSFIKHLLSYSIYLVKKMRLILYDQMKYQ